MTLVRTLVLLVSFASMIFGSVDAQIADGANAALLLYNPEKQVWYSQSHDGCAFQARKLGSGAQITVPADFDGDGIADPAVWNSESGTWTVVLSESDKIKTARLGVKGDIPVPADFDGDGKADIGVWKPVSGEWEYRPSAEAGQKPVSRGILGNYGDIPVPADYDGDGKAEPAVFRPVVNRWIIATFDGEKQLGFGLDAARYAIAADFDGDGKADPALYGNGVWLYFSTESGETEKFVFGFTDDLPAVNDYDGDGIADFGTFRDGKWYLYLSRGPKFKIVDFGRSGDLPISTFVAKNLPG